LRAEELKYLGTTNQNSIAEEIKIRFRSGNACYNPLKNQNFVFQVAIQKLKDQGI